MNVRYFRLWLLLVAAAMSQKAYSQCTSNAGSMSSAPLSGCENQALTGTFLGGEVLDGDDVLQFALHDNPGATLGTVLSVNASPIANFLPGSMSFGTTYYLSAIAGNNDGNGNVDLTDPCLSVSAGTPVIFQAPIIVSCLLDSLCMGGTLQPECFINGVGPFTYEWVGPGGFISNEPSPILPFYGTYSLTVTDANGCSFTTDFTWAQPVPLTVTVETQGELSCANSVVTVTTLITGGVPPYLYLWSNGFTGPVFDVLAPGTYSITIIDAQGCSQISIVTVEENLAACGAIIGSVIHDENENCLWELSEPGLNNWLVKAGKPTGEAFFGYTDAAGNYLISVLPGDYLVEVVHPALPFWENCDPPASVSVADSADTDTADFLLKTVVECPYLEVDISAPLLRRCFQNYFYVQYCNLGTATATDASVQVALDPQLIFSNASIPWTNLGNNVFSFEIGDLEPGDCGNFTINATVSCDAVLGETVCAEVHIFPDTACLPPSPIWSGAEVQLTSECTADSVIFTLENVGTGDMDSPLEFVVVEDGVMLMAPQEFQLPAGGSLTFSYPANGSTYVIMADQAANFPGFSAPTLAVEGCGTNGQGAFSLGFASQFPEDDADPFLSMDCHPVIGSYDPNDKNGFPTGYSAEHFIEKGQALDYHIRFQNTGTDTAFKVVVQDVISPFLDLATLRPGASSHPYFVEIHTDTLLFIFENILLPDSNVNEPGSHGFVKFRIEQKAETPVGATVENEAGIFFDFNPAVLTNTTTHRVGEHFLVKTNEPFLPEIEWQAFPNPFSQNVFFFVKGAEGQAVSVRLFDLAGRQVAAQTVTNGFAEIEREGWAAGLFFYEINVNSVAAGRGKLAVK